MKEKNRILDLASSIILGILSVWICYDGVNIHKEADTEFYLSPGFFPITLGIILFGLSILLFLRSKSKDIEINWKEFVKEIINSPDNRKIGIGIIILGIYALFIVNILPFWASGLLFLVFTIWTIKGTSLIKNIVLSTGFIIFVYAIFEKAFKVPLP